MSSNAFAPQGNTACLSVTSTAHSAVQVSGGGPANMNYVVTNVGPNTAWIVGAAPGPNGAPAPTLAAVAPTDGTPANGYPILAGSKESLTYPPNSYFSAITAATTTATLYITPGEGE